MGEVTSENLERLCDSLKVNMPRWKWTCAMKVDLLRWKWTCAIKLLRWKWTCDVAKGTGTEVEHTQALPTVNRMQLSGHDVSASLKFCWLRARSAQQSLYSV